MQITSKLGLEIIHRIEEYIEVDINIMDLNGVIVASTDKHRIDSLHSGAIKVIETGKPLILNEKNTQNYKGTRPGANLPITYKGKIEGVIGVSGNPQEILPMTGLIRISVEIIIEQIYIQRQAHFKENQWNSWLQQLLHPGGIDKEKLTDEATYSLRIDTKYNWQVIVLEGEDVQASLYSIRQKVKDRHINTLFILPFSRNEVVIAIPSEIENLDILLKEFMKFIKGSISIGVGEKAFDIPGIRLSYIQAKQALAFKKEAGTVSYSKSWKIERLVAAIKHDEYKHICHVYEKRLSDLEQTYIETIEVYLTTNFSIKESAHILHIHRNTLLYRLEQTKEKIGLDPRSFHDAFILKIILSKQSHCANAQ